jgi:hypothetical protein
VWLLSLVWLPVVGLWVAGARPFGWLPSASRFAIAGGVGAFLVSTVMTAFSLLGLAWQPVWIVLASVLVSALIGQVLAGQEPLRLAAYSRWNAAAIAGLAATASALVLCGLGVWAGAATSGDLLLFWGAKAQAFATAAGIDPAFLRDPHLEYLHPDYPPLVTNLYAFATMCAGRFSWFAATFTFPIGLAGLALGLTGILRLDHSRATAHAATCLITGCVALLGLEVDIAGNGEMPLLFFETLATAVLVSSRASEPAMQTLAGLLLGGAATAKVEGLPFGIAMVVAFLVLRRDLPSRGKALARLVSPAIVALGLWFAFGAANGAFRGYRGYGPFFSVHFEILPLVFSEVGRSLWLIGYGLPFLGPLALLLVRPRPWSGAALPLVTAAALTGFLVFTYLHDPHPAEWIWWSAARVFSPLVPLIALAAFAGRGLVRDSSGGVAASGGPPPEERARSGG